MNILFSAALDFSLLANFFIAFDRILSAKHPHLYNNFSQTYYIGAIVTFCAVYCVAFKAITYMSLTNEETLCQIGQSITGIAERIWFGSQAVLHCGVVVIYYRLTKIVESTSITEYQRINRSLNTMIAVSLFGYFLTFFGGCVVIAFSPNHRVFSTFEMPLGVLSNINNVAPFFIYYGRSTLYRKEFQMMLGWKRGDIAVMPIK